jgi:hypothetical protein
MRASAVNRSTPRTTNSSSGSKHLIRPAKVFACDNTVRVVAVVSTQNHIEQQQQQQQAPDWASKGACFYNTYVLLLWLCSSVL